MRPLVVVLALSISTGLVAQQMAVQGPARDTRSLATTTGTARISGVITTEETMPQPLRRARVTVSAVGTPGERTVVTDDRGLFSLTNLPAGRYSLSAAKGGYVRMAYGARRSDRPGTQIVLADGQAMTDLTLRLARGGVIAGTVLDETGMPAVGLQVRVLQYRLQAGGERALVAANAVGAQQFDTTDDRGAYRLFGLPSGEYVVTVSPRSVGVEIRAMTEDEMRLALAALQQPSVGRGGAPSGGRSTPPPADPSAEVVTMGYAPVYYPGTTNAGAAATVTIGMGEERAGVDMTIQMVRTAKIEGTVVAPAGVPVQGASVMLLPMGLIAPGNLGLNRAAVSADGKFSFTGVAPGQYTVSARTGRSNTVMQMGAGGDMMTFTTAVAGTPLGRAGGAGANAGVAAEPPPNLWALADVNLNGQNLTGVSLTLQPGMTLTGQLVFEGLKTPAPKDLSRARVTLTPVGSASGPVTMSGSVQVDASGKFTAAGLSPGRYRFSATVPPDPGVLGSWTLRSAVAAGRDALDLPLEIGPNEAISDAVLTFTDATQDVSGMLQDASGRPAPDYTIVVFAADAKLWMPGARRIRTSRPATDGRFTVTGLPAGAYRIAAVTDMAPADSTDPAFLQLLMEASLPFTLAPGEKRVQDFRIGGRPSP